MRNQILRSISALIAPMLIGLSLFLAACSGGNSQSAETIAGGLSGEAMANLGISFPADKQDLETYEGLEVGFTEEGLPFRGDPDAQITLIEYSDYLCPFCNRHFNETLPTLYETYGESGQVNFVFSDFPLVSLHPTAPVGHAAALCVAEQGPDLFWQMHDDLFARQAQWNSLRDPAEFVAGLAEAIGADMDDYDECMASGRTGSQVNDSVSQTLAIGFGGTPSFRIVDRQSGQVFPLVGAQPLAVFGDALDKLLEGETPAGLESESADASTIEEIDQDEVPKVTFDFDADLETYKGIPVGFTEEGYPFMGNPDAPITLVEFSDYLCPFCGRHFNQTLPALTDNYFASGEVNFVFRDMPLASLHPTAHFGHEGANCAGEQGAALYWAMHDQLFASQNQWANLPDPEEYVAGVAENLGVNMKAYAECMADSQTAALVEERVTEGRGLGYNGTPAFQVLVNETGGMHEISGAQPLPVFSEMLDALIAGEELPEADTAEAELPLWASAEGLAPDPNRPGFTIAGDPFKGNPEAPVVVVEFSDFQCPACQQHALEIQPELDRRLVESGEIMWVFKPLPLKEHSNALLAAVVAECAGEQGHFWEMHHRLFEGLDSWSGDGDEGQFMVLAEEEGLDMAAFSECYNGRAALERVVGDMYDAEGVTETTPAFVVLKDGRGSLVPGSRPIEEFERLIRSRLDGDASSDRSQGQG